MHWDVRIIERMEIDSENGAQKLRPILCCLGGDIEPGVLGQRPHNSRRTKPDITWKFKRCDFRALGNCGWSGLNCMGFEREEPKKSPFSM